MKKGFTIVELLVILAVISVLGVVLVDVFLRSLRGADKAQILAKLQQNGQVAVDTIDKAIKNADAIVCPQEGTGTVAKDTIILMVAKDGKFTRFKFANWTSGSINNGKIQVNYPNIAADTFTNPDNTELRAQYCAGTSQDESYTDLTDASDKGVSVKDGYFQKNKRPGFKDIVTIFFKISPSIKFPNSNLVEPVTFQTTMEVR